MWGKEILLEDPLDLPLVGGGGVIPTPLNRFIADNELIAIKLCFYDILNTNSPFDEILRTCLSRSILYWEKLFKNIDQKFFIVSKTQIFRDIIDYYYAVGIPNAKFEKYFTFKFVYCTPMFLQEWVHQCTCVYITGLDDSVGIWFNATLLEL